MMHLGTLLFLVRDAGYPNRDDEYDDTYDTKLAKLITSQQPNNRELRKG